ncbi:MAG: repeat-containing protein [Schlesneria sp.]|nr:repeat-containing protein [Schlesneria sp.]
MVIKRTALAFVAVWCLACSAMSTHAEDHVLRTFKKIKITDQFFSEGMYYGDFNRDGKTDVTAGSLWYAGPEFKTATEIRPAKPFDPLNYSNAFLSFAYDFNGDEWDDIVIVGFPGEAVHWYQNPKGEPGHWKQHMAFAIADNESPGFGDITGDGRPELICHTDGYLGYAEPDWKDPTKPWSFRQISAKSGWGKYQHGMGYGDVNGDGRKDFLLREGWWEQPTADKIGETWTLHKYDFGGGGAQMHVYDVDGDKDNDVITSLQAHGFGLAWFENIKDDKGEITFKQHLITGDKPQDNKYGVKFSQLHAVDLVDMDGDGVKDIITGKRYWAHGPKGDAEPDAPAVLYWFKLVRSDSGVDFIPHEIDNDSGVGTQVIAADVTNDGLPDVLVGNKKGHFVFVQETRKVSKDEWDKAQPKPLAK